MAKVTVLVCLPITVEVDDATYEELHLPVVENPAEEDLPQERYDDWHNAIERVGKMVGRDLDPEEGGEWFSLGNIDAIEALDGVMAILDEERQIIAQA